MADKLRMFHWLLISAAIYTAAIVLADMQLLPQIQVALWKIGHITVAAYAGYWIDRHTFRDCRLNARSDPRLHVRRAIIIGAAMLAVSMGM